MAPVFVWRCLWRIRSAWVRQTRVASLDAEGARRASVRRMRVNPLGSAKQTKDPPCAGLLFVLYSLWSIRNARVRTEAGKAGRQTREARPVGVRAEGPNQSPRECQVLQRIGQLTAGDPSRRGSMIVGEKTYSRWPINFRGLVCGGCLKIGKAPASSARRCLQRDCRQAVSGRDDHRRQRRRTRTRWVLPMDVEFA